jgi:hypothetical protein
VANFRKVDVLCPEREFALHRLVELSRQVSEIIEQLTEAKDAELRQAYLAELRVLRQHMHGVRIAMCEHCKEHGC